MDYALINPHDNFYPIYLTESDEVIDRMENNLLKSAQKVALEQYSSDNGNFKYKYTSVEPESVHEAICLKSLKFPHREIDILKLDSFQKNTILRVKTRNLEIRLTLDFLKSIRKHIPKIRNESLSFYR